MGSGAGAEVGEGVEGALLVEGCSKDGEEEVSCEDEGEEEAFTCDVF